MQVNVYIPKGKEQLLDALADEARRTGRSKNELILEAIEQRVSASRVPAYRIFSLGSGEVHREDLYEDRID